MENNVAEAVRLFGAYTAGGFQTWQLAGSAKASCRAHIMSALYGEKVKQSAAGVFALREALCHYLRIEGDCLAAKDSALYALCKGHAELTAGCA